MKTLQQITRECIEKSYQQGNISLSQSWAVISEANAKELFKAILKASDAALRSDLCSDFPTSKTQIQFVQGQVELAWDALWDLRDEIEQGRHVDQMITEAREQSL